MTSKRMRRSIHEDTPANRISKGMISAGVSRGISPGTEGSKGMVSLGVRRGKSPASSIAKGKPSAVKRANGGSLGDGDPADFKKIKLARKRDKELDTPHLNYKSGGKLKGFHHKSSRGR